MGGALQKRLKRILSPQGQICFLGQKQMHKVYELTIAHFVIFPNSVNLLITL